MSEQNNQILPDEKVLELSDLKPGDILIFGTDFSPIDNLITALTNSNATHGALFYQTAKLRSLRIPVFRALTCIKSAKDPWVKTNREWSMYAA